MTQAPQLRPLGAALGTEALGIDLSKPLDADTFAWIQAAFAEHPVLVFRDQDLGAPELAAFGRRFGVPRPHALTKYRHVGGRRRGRSSRSSQITLPRSASSTITAGASAMY